MDRSVISASCRTEKGRRAANEDACLVMTSDQLGGALDCLLVIADGMGGRTSGAVASETAVSAVKETVLSLQSAPDTADVLSHALSKANEAVYREASRDPALKGMGTTCVAAAIAGSRLFCAHLGDSRAYLLRDGDLVQLTQDHSFVAEKVRSGEMTEEEARASRFRNVITRAIGLEAEASPEMVDTELRSGDVVLLCTDGLSTPVSDDGMADILCSSSTAAEACDRLVRSALDNGGSDNITVIVAVCGAASRKTEHAPQRPAPRKGTPWILPALVALFVGLAVGFILGLSPLRDLLPEWPATAPEVEHAAEPDLTGIEYDDPVSLYYAPVQSGLLTLDDRGYIHVADLQGRLVRLDVSGQVIHEFPAREQLQPVVQTPAPRIAADRAGNLYLSDPKGHRILKYAPDGVFESAIAEGTLTSPGALAVDEAGVIYVIDGARLKAIRPSRAVRTESKRPPSAIDR